MTKDYAIALVRDSTTPLADQIFTALYKYIVTGEMGPGEKLPTERELAETLRVSRGTIKRAYAKLEQANAIFIRKGSGSYVCNNMVLLEKNQKEEAADIITQMFQRLQNLGLSNREISNLINLHHSTLANRQSKINIMVVSNNHEILAELEQQLSYLSSTSLLLFTLSFMTLSSIENNNDPIQMLYNYDLIIATSIDYAAITGLVPIYRSKTIEATIAPCTETLVELSRLPRESKINVIYRTHVFRGMIHRTLLNLGFQEQNIYAYFEHDYNPTKHSDNGVSVVINFNESPVYINPAFKARNREFVQQGGTLLYFRYRIERKALIAIEDRIQSLLDSAGSPHDSH